MCGRYSLTVPPTILIKCFKLAGAADNLRPRFNIAPTQEIAVILNRNPECVDLAHWGLIPSWAKDRSIASRLINARGETLSEKPAFRSAFLHRRCLILADGFYEWARNRDGSKTPLRITLASGEPFAFAGLWEEWTSPEGEIITSCCIITTAPNDMIAAFHYRMPVILHRQDERVWLESQTSVDMLKKLIALPYPAELMKSYAVSTLVNNPRNDDPVIIEPV